MKENVGKVDRIGRSVIGPALMGFGAIRWGGNRGEPAGLVAMVAGALIVESAITRVCPINAALGLDTRSIEEIERDLKTTRVHHREALMDKKPYDRRQSVEAPR